MKHRRRILVVSHQPLGGIRTYLKYLYAGFPADRYDITLLTGPTQEREALIQDFAGGAVTVREAPVVSGRSLLPLAVAQHLAGPGADLVHSQGFASATLAAPGCIPFRAPHVMTIHGILETRYLEGRFARLKALAFDRAMRQVDVFHGVGREITEDVRGLVPAMRRPGARQVVIEHGVDAVRFGADVPGARAAVLADLGIAEDTLVFGYFGRFMPQKGFDVILRACAALGETCGGRPYRVLAVGSGDYRAPLQAKAADLGVDDRIVFRPFCADIRPLMQGCDAVLMPSNWEAWGLLAAEVLCAGVPLICSRCIGLREAVADTPAITMEPGDHHGLASAMAGLAADVDAGTPFRAFRPQAMARYDMARTVARTRELFDELMDG